MIGGLRRETNPLYYLVLLTTVLWISGLLVFSFAQEETVLTGSVYLLFGIWTVLPIAMSFDAGIVRQKFAMSIPLSILLIIAAAIPPVSPLAGVAYVLYRSRVVGGTA